MNNYNEMDPNPYNWRYDQHNITTIAKIYKGIKIHLTANKSIKIRCLLLWHYVIAELLKKRICFYIGNNYTSFDWRTFKLSYTKRDQQIEFDSDDVDERQAKKVTHIRYEYSKYPWNMKWNVDVFYRDGDPEDVFNVNYEMYQNRIDTFMKKGF